MPQPSTDITQLRTVRDVAERSAEGGASANGNNPTLDARAGMEFIEDGVKRKK